MLYSGCLTRGVTGGGAAPLQGARAPAKGVLLFGPPGAPLALTDTRPVTLTVLE